jgi:hypothetical protein
MKRTKLIEYTLIVIAAIFGYNFFESLFGVFAQVILSLNNRNIDLQKEFIPYLILGGGYFLLFFLIIRKCREIAIYLNGNNPEEIVPIKIGKKATLHLIILGICITTILNVLPDLLIYLYDSLKTKRMEQQYEDFSFRLDQEKFIVKIIRLVIAVIIMVTSKEIAQWFLKNDGKEELILEAETKDENTNG